MSRLKNLVKKGAALLLGAALSTTAIAATTSRHVTFLQSYEQLSSYVGQDGIYFVANAASSTADGAHGDPTVKAGWAMYVYQGSSATAGSGISRGGWRKIAEGESLDSSVNELLLRNYVSYFVRTNDLEMISRTYETKAAHNSELAVVRNDIANHEGRITTNEGNISSIRDRVRTVEVKADRNMDDIAVINQKLDDMQLDEVRRNLIDATNRVTIAEKNIADTIVVVTNAVEAVTRMEADVTTNKLRIGELDYGHNVNSQKIEAIETFIGGDALAKQAELDAAVSNLTAAIEAAIAAAKAHSDSNDTATVTYAYSYADRVGSNAVVQAESIADTKKSEAIAAANEYTDAAIASATDRAYVDAQDAAVSNNVLAAANKYTITVATNCVDLVMAFGDEKERNLQKEDRQHLATATNFAKQVAGEVLTSANVYTDTEIGKITGGELKYVHVGETASEPFTVPGDPDNEYTFKGYQTVLGPGAINNPVMNSFNYGGHVYNLLINPTAINLGTSAVYPSYTYGSFNINLGIDNQVGYGTGSSTNSNGEIYNARYATVIGTSSKAKMMHSYAYGSQINALMGNTTVIGYGGSATSEWSTVIGHGRRPNGGSSTYDKQFTTWEEADTYLKTLSDNTFKGSHFEVKPDGGVRTLYTITGVRSEPNADGYYYDYLETPDDEYDYIPGGYDWRYGKSHGPGTFNIVAWHRNWRTSPGLKAVWINDDRLDTLVEGVSMDKIHEAIYGPPVSLTQSQINKGIGFDGSGRDENCPIQIGKYAESALGQDVVSGVTASNTKIRNVGIAIGAHAKTVGASSTKNQNIAIGFAAEAVGSSMISIGPGAKDIENEDEWTGNSTYAKGSATTAIGYSAKAYGNYALSIGSGASGTGLKDTMASNNYTVAVGPSAQALATYAVGLGYDATSTASGAVQIGAGVNNEANTLKFRDTTIVKNGKICGFDDTSLDPKEIDISEAVSNQSEEVSLRMKPHIVNTLTTTVQCGPGTEIYLDPEGSRNYEVFVPNEEQFIHGLPLCCQSEFDDTTIKTVYTGKKDTASKLPVMIKIQQPTKKCVVITVNELDDGTDWTPSVTNSFICYDGVSGKFYCDGNKRSVEGKSLHHATEFKIAYPTSTGVTTNDFVAASTSGDNLIPGTYYDYAAASELAPTDLAINDSATVKTWYEIIYKTVNGDAATFRQELKFSKDGKYLINDPDAVVE